MHDFISKLGNLTQKRFAKQTLLQWLSVLLLTLTSVVQNVGFGDAGQSSEKRGTGVA